MSMDKSLYDLWKKEKPDKYAELSNIIYEIGRCTNQFPRFETLKWDLWGLDYQAIQDEQFSKEDLIEQIKIVNK